nr:serine protease inhibitor A3F-like [Penaeus vannamei]
MISKNKYRLIFQREVALSRGTGSGIGRTKPKPDAAAADINAETRGKIPKLIQPSFVKGAKMVLTNAVYFKGFWKYPFKPQRTHKDKFFVTPEESVQVDMMSQTRRFNIGLEEVSRPGAGDALQGRQRVHGGAPPAMWKGIQDGDWLVQRLKPKLVSELKAMPSVSLRVKFPKFSVESTLGDELISFKKRNPGKLDVNLCWPSRWWLKGKLAREGFRA